MDSEDIQISLARINSDLDRIFKSRGWVHILNATQEPNHLENILGASIFHVCDLKLRINRILEAQKHKEAV